MKKTFFFIFLVLVPRLVFAQAFAPGQGFDTGNKSSTECSTKGCNLNSSTTLASQNICLANGTNCQVAGATGSTDTAIITANGTGGKTTQGSLCTVDINGNLLCPGSLGGSNSLTAFTNAPKAYEGLVATRSRISDTADLTRTQMMSRSVHIASETISRVKIAIPNWYSIGSSPYADTGTGTTASVKASIEYPAGTFNQLKFSGSTTGSIPDKTTLVSDYINLTTVIPAGATFFVRIYFLNSGGIFYVVNNGDSAAGGGIEVGTTGITDKTASGTVSSSGSNIVPVAIIGWTQKPSIVLIGDSRCVGLNDTVDGNLNTGEFAKSLGTQYGYIMNCRQSDLGFRFLVTANDYLRQDLLKYASHVVDGYGYNDIWIFNNTAAQLLTTKLSLLSLIHTKAPNAKIYGITIGPRTTSSDSWATTANQTVFNGTSEANRVAFNAIVRSVNFGADGFFDVADGNESARDSGKWQVDGTANKYTSDGVHESAFANTIIASSGTVPNNFPYIGSYYTADFNGFRTTPPATQTIAAGGTINADACGGLKKISSAGAVTTDTTNTFTAPATLNNNCSMQVLNVGANNITLDNNANFVSLGGVDILLKPNQAVTVNSTGLSGAWYQVAPVTFSGTANQATCWTTAGTLGSCTSVVGVGGACTCS